MPFFYLLKIYKSITEFIKIPSCTITIVWVLTTACTSTSTLWAWTARFVSSVMKRTWARTSMSIRRRWMWWSLVRWPMVRIISMTFSMMLWWWSFWDFSSAVLMFVMIISRFWSWIVSSWVMSVVMVVVMVSMVRSFVTPGKINYVQKWGGIYLDRSRPRAPLLPLPLPRSELKLRSRPPPPPLILLMN